MAQRPKPYSTIKTIAHNGMMPAASIRALADEIATTRDGMDITRPYVHGLKQPRDPRLMSVADWGVYDEILKDDQVKSTIQQRISAVVSRDWDVVPGDDQDPRSVEAAEALKDNLLEIGWDRITGKMLMATFYGYSVSELLWDKDKPLWFKDIKVRHARRFRYDQDDELRLITTGNTHKGMALDPYKFWVVQTGASDDDEPYGRGLAEWLFWPTLFKRNGIRFWNNFLDKFGSPTAIGKYPAGTTPDQINNLLGAMQAIATDAGVAIPERMSVEFLEAVRSGTGDYDKMWSKCDASISKIVLSQTMTTDDGSSNSQAQVHDGVKLEVIKADADLVTDSFTCGPARWWTTFNYGADVATPRVTRDVKEPIDSQREAQTDTALKAHGWERTDESFSETYGDGYRRIVTSNAVANPQREPAAEEAAEFAASDPKPLYVSRKLLNTSDIIDWARSQGFTNLIEPDDMHVTIAYSKRPVNWFKMGDDLGYQMEPLAIQPGGPRQVAPLGDQGAIVLHFYSGHLQARHRHIREAGASWDYPEYLPHVTLTYGGDDIDIDAIEPYTGLLLFGPEIFEGITGDWHESVSSVQLSENEDGFITADEDAEIVEELIAADGFRVAEAMTGSVFDRISQASSADELQAILEDEAINLMDDNPLRESIERAAFAMRLNEENSAPNA